MTPLVIIELVVEVLKLIRIRTENMTEEQIQREIEIAWALFKPIIWPFLPHETKVLLENLEKLEQTKTTN